MNTKRKTDTPQGRPKARLPENFEEIAEAYRSGRLSADDAAKIAGMSRATFYRKLQGSAPHNERCATCRYQCGLPEDIFGARLVCIHPDRAPGIMEYSGSCRDWAPGEEQPLDTLVRADSLAEKRDPEADAALAGLLRGAAEKDASGKTGLLAAQYIECSDRKGFSDLFKLLTETELLQFFEKITM